MLKVTSDLIRLESHPMTDYAWPFWQSAALLMFIGILTGLDPATTAMFSAPTWSVMSGLVMIAVSFPVMVAFLRWWLKRGERWDGQGQLFNLIVAASAIDVLGAGLTALGVPPLLTMPIFLYAIWVGANAIEGACNVSLRYAIGGVVLSMLPAMIVIMVSSGVMFLLFSAMGVMLPPAGVTP